MRARTWLAWGVVLGGFVVVYGGCGGDDSTLSTIDSGGPGDATNEGAPTDTGGGDTANEAGGNESGGNDGAGDGSGGDGAGDGSNNDSGVACSPNGSACPLASDAGSINGLCKSSTCSPCADPADDSACTSAYGDGGSYICSVDTCTPGNCHDSSTCNGEVCGVTTAHFCGKCTLDSQCAGDSYYNGKGDTMCSTQPGTCVTPTCNVTDGSPCPNNPADVCCSQVCFTGDCCTNAQCDADGGGNTPACVNHKCTSCDSVSGNTYYVDPVNGSDASTSTGSDKAGGQTASVCAFKTLTHAIAVVTAANPPPGTKIVILSNNSGVAIPYSGSTETFPFVVPVNTEITTQGGTVTVNVPALVTFGDAGTGPGVGFILRYANAQVDTITVDGGSNTSAHGALVLGTSNTPTQIGPSFVAQHFTGGAGIRVADGGTVTIKGGTQSIHNLRGLHLQGTGQATINNTATPNVNFDNNSQYGIWVTAHGMIALTGTPGQGGAGTVTANNNTLAGMQFDGDETNGFPPVSTVTGLVAWNNGNLGAGARLSAGSFVKIRSSQFLAQGIGVDILSAANVSNWQYDTQGIDMGTSGQSDPGLNTFQVPPPGDGGASSQNSLGGVCWNIPASKSQPLKAAGDLWVGNGDGGAQIVLDCSQVANNNVSLASTSTCSGATNLGGQLTGNNPNLNYCVK